MNKDGKLVSNLTQTNIKTQSFIERFKAGTSSLAEDGFPSADQNLHKLKSPTFENSPHVKE